MLKLTVYINACGSPMRRTNMSKGFVYILSNEAFPDLFKVGFSERLPTRAGELATTGVPYDFVVEYYCITIDADIAEQEIHKHLADFRVSKDREFFGSPYRKQGKP